MVNELPMLEIKYVLAIWNLVTSKLVVTYGYVII
jgi:hypothetical protein